jgi:hypothetical protein
MSKIKSLIVKSEIDKVIKSHKCQANNKHTLLKEELRLKVKTGRSYTHYCKECAKIIISKDIEKLNLLKEQIEKNI